MAGLGSRWAALSGRRFLLRRMDYAILGRSMPAVGDPLRAESLALPVGCLLALALLVGSAAMAVLRPA
nr:type VII secretion protein EccB [Mycobacterium sp.]